MHSKRISDLHPSPCPNLCANKDVNIWQRYDWIAAIYTDLPLRICLPLLTSLPLPDVDARRRKTGANVTGCLIAGEPPQSSEMKKMPRPPKVDSPLTYAAYIKDLRT